MIGFRAYTRLLQLVHNGLLVPMTNEETNHWKVAIQSRRPGEQILQVH